MRIGEVAARAGVNIQTLRYYERRGLLADPRRSPSGYREYPLEAVRRVRFIKRAQELGFTLNEIDDLLELRDDRRSERAQVRAAALAKVADIDAKIRGLTAMRRALGVLIDYCKTASGPRECPILEILDEPARRVRSSAEQPRP